MIDRHSPVPVYYQIEQYIEELIDRQQLKIGERIPSERELTEQFQVSRMTVRQALADLVNAGALLRLKGKGTFVADRNKLEKKLSQIDGFTEDMLRRGMKPGSQLIAFEQIKANPKIAERLGLMPEEAAVFVIKRIRLADAQPMAIETTYIPCRLVSGLTEKMLSNRSLYDYLEQDQGFTIDRAEESLEAAIVTSDEARLLEVSPNSPVLLIERLTFTKDEKKIEFTKSLYRADRYKFMISLSHK
ncbi:MAG: GntR family transcriptional regulator [Sporolactobacillus sp.]